MNNKLGAQAVVVGAGMGGLAAAAALSPCFDRVSIIDKDTIPTGDEVRLGVGQGAHTHQLLKAGEETLERLLPGLREALYAAGAAEIRVGRDVIFFDPGGPLPECDPGFSVTALSRPRYERVLRDKVLALANVTLRHDTPVAGCLVEDGHCIGVELAEGEKVLADLVVDASGMNGPLCAKLAEDGHADFDSEMVKINVAYTTVRFQKPEGWRGDRKGVFVLPPPPGNQFALLLPIEDDQWTVSLGVRGDTPLPRNHEEFSAFAKSLPVSGVYDRVKDATPLTPFKAFRKTHAVRRQFGAARRWPGRLIPVGDTMTSFNPTFGQGMTVAALQAGTLANLLAERAASGGGLDDLGAAYFPPAEAAAAAAWGLAIGSDYSYAETEGPRPADFAQQQFSGRVFRQLCGSEPEFLVLRMRMGHMLESGMALREGPLSARFGAAIQAAQQAQAAG